jgi:hypothetical protein
MGFRKVSIGRAAVFLLPKAKLDIIRDEVNHFLAENFESFTLEEGNDIKGYWRKSYDGILVRYTVSFKGKDRIPLLDEFLARIASKINEECIYVSTGEDVWHVFPN